MNGLSSFLLFAQEYERPVQRSLLVWMYEALGPFYLLVLPLSGFLVFLGACLVVALSRRPAVVAAYLVFLPLPLLIGVYGTVQGFIASLSVIATAAGSPQPAEVAEGVSTGLFTSVVGLTVTFPSYFVLAIGLFLRTVFRRDERSA
jgi:hypothetical protein